MKSTIILALASMAIAAPTPHHREPPAARSRFQHWNQQWTGCPEVSHPRALGVCIQNPNANSQFLGSGSSTENGVTENAGCKEYTFIFARGTTEIGNMGTVIGPPLAKQLNSLTGDKVTVQGVDYPADAAGNAVMGAAGGPAMAKLVKQALSQCPKTKVLLGGYSQGAMVVHNAAQSLSADQITAAVLFGDPLKAQSVGQVASDKVKEFCHLGDPVCLNGVNGMAHITYGTDAAAAGKFLIEAAGGASTSS
ncbi:uncharacterized protein N7487_006581 [Penicillium crustosum]|uniref:uncharacterized protein n=1 Tax=Penicillium crustosum TaxID=36656 RepID=UPI0023915763|nr:uncharacterized protein N7487_006581 [Penicillium crustosum]KAJ5412222.1 hypothetical protein N7487_006581 [Penicillium crustosum]